MSEPKPFASLGPTLLARKGGARPAMRPQLGVMPGAGLTPAQPFQMAEADLEDLGWNDMGEPDDQPAEAPDNVVAAFTQAPRTPEADPEPEVRRQQRAIGDAVAAKRAPVSLPVAVEPRRAAFTLRLDARRHLKLRLASTVKNRSAQALVTQALDKFLSDIPELEALATQLQRD